MKLALVTALVLASSTVFAADLVQKRTPNGGTEMYTNTMVGQGSLQNGCFLPKQYAGHPVTGFNPKVVQLGMITEFVDCTLPVAPKPMMKAVTAPAKVAPVAAPTPAPAPVASAPVKASPAAVPALKKIRE